MHRKLTRASLIAAASLLAIGQVHAASQVTLFGTADAGLTSLNAGGHTRTGMTHSSGNVSRIGFKGTEDLGNGYQAGFWLESAVNLKDGSAGAPGGTYWNRRATVSMMGPFGELRLGRDDSVTFLPTLIFDPFLTNGVAGTYTFVMNGAPIQISNAISYFTPHFGGFWGQAQYAFKPAGATGSGAYRGLRGGYSQGPLNLSLAAARLDDRTKGNLKIANLAGSYAFGNLKPSFILAREDRSGGVTVSGAQAGLSYNVGPNWFRVSLGGYWTTHGPHADWQKLGLGYAYNFSKSTMLYTAASLIHNNGKSARPIRVQGLASPTNTLGHPASGFEVGLRHFF